MIKIPETITVRGVRITVKQVPSYDGDGRALVSKSLILIDADSEETMKEHIFFHELAHFFLSFMGDENADEVAVDSCAALLKDVVNGLAGERNDL